MSRLVALDLPPGDALLAAIDRCAERGDAVLPLDPAAPEVTRRRLLDEVRPDAVLDASGGEVALPDPLPTPAGTAIVVATSGSTGTPKGVALSADALAWSARASAARIGAEPGDRWLACLPPHHIAGFSVLWRSRWAGTTPLVLPGFDVAAVAEALRSVELVSLVPTQLRRLLEAGADLSGLRAVLLGGARASSELLDRARAGGVRVVLTYGMSETCGGCVYDAVPLEGVEVRADDDGLLLVRGPVLLTGYRPGGSPLDAGGWFPTADLGRVLPDGRVEVLGRADDVINTGGVKVHAGAVERVLSDLPELAEVAVTGRPDPEWGERVVAVAVLRPGATPPPLDRVRSLVRTAVGPAAAPRELLVVDDLPRLATGKVDRLALRAASTEP
jgi:o-succinylbenzoate---CoA ligase